MSRNRERDNAQLDVKRWVEALDAEIESFEMRRARRTTPSPTGYSDAMHIENLSIREVLLRGLDPKRGRKFNGRVLLELRCQGKGHCLARVYPTTQRPVLIPSVAGLPIGRNREKAARFSEERQRTRDWNRLFRSLGEGVPSHRDNWIEEYPGSRRGEQSHFAIRGLTVLGARHREATAVLDDGREAVPAHEFLCRCGTNWVATADVMHALDAQQRVLQVPSLWSGTIYDHNSDIARADAAE